MKINLKAFALAMGILVAVLTFILTFWYSITGYAEPAVSLISSIYAKLTPMVYDPLARTIKESSLIRNLGSITLLTLFSFVDGMILGTLFASLHNLFLPGKKKG